MSALLESIALKYAKKLGLDYITDEAREYAAKKLGVDTKNPENPKYAISIGNMNIDPMKIITNQAIKNAIGGGKISMGGGIPLIAGGLALAYMRNPLRQGSMNYNPALKGQIDYLSGMNGMIGSNQSSGLLQYGPNSVLRGQNVVSMFGNNDYAKNLQKYIDKMEAKKTKGYNTIGFGPFKTKTTGFTDFQQSQLDKAKRELENLTTDEFDKVDEFMSAPASTQTGPTIINKSNGNNKDNNKTNNTSKNTSSRKTSGGHSGSGYQGATGSHHYRRGGIASL